MNDKQSPSKMEAKDLDLYYGDFLIEIGRASCRERV